MPELFEHQKNFLDEVIDLKEPVRACLYFKTGSGKSLAAILAMKYLGYDSALVIAPPSTHKQWEKTGEDHGITVFPMSHAKFRMKTTKVARYMPVIADEFHLFGGIKSLGWRKLDQLSRGLNAPMLLLSATPNYNDAERVYCVQHILSPHVTKGGFLQFIYENCTTVQNPFAMTPKVTGFKDYPDAAAFLADLPRVYHLPDDAEFTYIDLPYREDAQDELFTLRYNAREHRIIASMMELTHVLRLQSLLTEQKRIKSEVFDKVCELIDEHGTVLIFANHATVAIALKDTMHDAGRGCMLVTGSTTKTMKALTIERFNTRGGVLIGTASLATGTDGMDKVCDTLIILDDTDDNALRRQLIGRILSRGEEDLRVDKHIFRFVPA